MRSLVVCFSLHMLLIMLLLVVVLIVAAVVGVKPATRRARQPTHKWKKTPLSTLLATRQQAVGEHLNSQRLVPRPSQHYYQKRK